MKPTYLYLPVTNLDQSVELYARLGGEVSWRNSQTAILRWPNTDIEIMLDLEPAEGGTPAGLMFAVDSVTETVANLRNQVQFVGTPFAVPGGSCIEARDHAGNSLQFIDEVKP